ncbi:MAG: ABC transporter ATP-binding protein [Candidatus Ancillula trichonymphae]|jgi:ABC-2 type transport system ATP-binding protein|nr:ABC transporter ATP-binding protein [Candidatus Ancillula trichonymphae]
MNNLLNLNDLSFSYDSEREILENFDLCINAGDKVLLKGSNGTGKSTLLKILSHYIENDSLSYTLKFHEKTHFADIRQHLAFIPDEVFAFEDLTAIQNIKFFQLFWQLDNLYYDKVVEICSLFNIGHSLEDKVSSFSLGMKNKLFLALNLAYNAELYLLDEPFNALDKDAQVSLINWINDSQAAYIIATHLLPPDLMQHLKLT